MSDTPPETSVEIHLEDLLLGIISYLAVLFVLIGIGYLLIGVGGMFIGIGLTFGLVAYVHVVIRRAKKRK